MDSGLASALSHILNSAGGQVAGTDAWKTGKTSEAMQSLRSAWGWFRWFSLLPSSHNTFDSAMSASLKPKSNKRLVAALAFAVVGMFGFGYALVPLYDIFCEITGIGGKPAIAESLKAPDTLTVGDRSVKIEFTSTAAQNLNWKIEPADSVRVNVGSVIVAEYKVTNVSNRAVNAQAIPSITPLEGAKHLVKVDCFCFTGQTLEAGEQRSMPVRFYVDPELSEKINTLTLSYSFYEIDQAQSNSG